MKKETKIEELERRIAKLESERIVIMPIAPTTPQKQQIPVPHYHNGTPCYMNPCVVC